MKNSVRPGLSDENLKLFVVFVFITLIIVIGLMLFNKSQQKPEQFTEVFFGKNMEKIPAGRETSFSFFVSNHEGKKTDYEYFLEFENKTLNKRVSLEGKESKEFIEKISFNSPGEKKVSLRLKNLDSNKFLELWQWIEVEEK